MREVIVEQATGKVVTDNIDPDYFVDGDEFFRSGFYETWRAAVYSEIVEPISSGQLTDREEDESMYDYVNRFWNLEALADRVLAWHSPKWGNGGYYLSVNPETFWEMLGEYERRD